METEFQDRPDDQSVPGCFSWGFFVIWTTLVGVLTVLFDVFVVPTYGIWLYSCGLFALLSMPALLVAAISRRRWMLVTYLAFMLLAISLVVVPWHPRKMFVWTLFSVKTGMSVDEVEAIMGSYIKGRGAGWLQPVPPQYPEGAERTKATGTMTYRWNSTDWRYNSDWGQVTFEGGRVVKVEFLPD